MINIRKAVMADKADFRRIWDKCFEDSDKFSTWLFDTRFVPEYSLCLEQDGKIAAVLQLLPMFLRIRGRAVPSAMLMGVSTDPDYGGRGYMKRLMAYLMEHTAEKGIYVIANTPARLNTYYFAGHYPVSDIDFIEGRTDRTVKAEGVRLGGDIAAVRGRLFELYTDFAKDYSAVAYRSYADFMLKAEDYLADNGLLAIHETDGVIDGYSFFYDTEELLYAEETVAENERAFNEIVKFIAAFGDNKAYKIKTPAQGNYGIPHNVMGVASVTGLLKCLNIQSGICVKIHDALVKENNGVFALNGGAGGKEYALETEIQYFTQLITGYRSIEELIADGAVTVRDEKMCRDIGRLLPKQKTFIFDEY